MADIDLAISQPIINVDITVPTNSVDLTITGVRGLPGDNKRVLDITSSATPTINTDNYDVVNISALAVAITSMTTNLTGTPDNFDNLIFRIEDNGVARAITWGAKFVQRGINLPTTTVSNKMLTVGFQYDTVNANWGCIASVQEV
jgi:hypothetical protein